MIISDPENYPLFSRIDALRFHARSDKSGLLREELDAEIKELNKVLERDLQKGYGNKNFRKHVPEWHKLVGSTPESHDVPAEARQAVVRKIECLVRALEEKWGL